MNEHEIINQWLASAPTLSGAPQLDAEGLCVLEHSEDVLVFVESKPDTGVCHLYSPAASAPEGFPPDVLFESALTLNLYGAPLGGCWLAYEPEHQVLMLCLNLSVAKTDAQEFSNALQNFVLALTEARERLILTPAEAEDLQDETLVSA